jgi:hypothetical protein
MIQSRRTGNNNGGCDTATGFGIATTTTRSNLCRGILDAKVIIIIIIVIIL